MRVGIVGYGNLGQYLVDFIQNNGSKHDLVLDFVWNRSLSKLEHIQQTLILKDLKDVTTRSVDLIVEVAHPGIIKEYGELFLSVADVMVGSSTALAEAHVEESLRNACVAHKRGLYVPSGAFWGGQDILKMANVGTLRGLKVTMKKHPSAFRLQGKIKEMNDKILLDAKSTHPVTLYEGPVRDLCLLAPNNVNTMAAAALAAHNLGFDDVVGSLVSDPGLLNWHIVEIEITGISNKSGDAFVVKTVRKNPANPGVVTGSATYGSFCSSLLLARNNGVGVHMC